MRTNRVLQLATVVVVMAMAGHLLMHLEPNGHPGAADHHRVVAHAGTASSTLTAVDATTSDENGGGHLMAALCMAVLAAAALAALSRLTGRSALSALASPATVGRRFPRRLRAPPLAPSRIDAGVLLRV